MLKYLLPQACGGVAEEEISGDVAEAEVDLEVPIMAVI